MKTAILFAVRSLEIFILQELFYFFCFLSDLQICPARESTSPPIQVFFDSTSPLNSSRNIDPAQPRWNTGHVPWIFVLSAFSPKIVDKRILNPSEMATSSSSTTFCPYSRSYWQSALMLRAYLFSTLEKTHISWCSSNELQSWITDSSRYYFINFKSTFFSNKQAANSYFLPFD